MASTLLIPESERSEAQLRELLARADAEALRGFCREAHPATVADLLSQLEPTEIKQALELVELPTRAQIFSHLDLELQARLVSLLDREAMARLLEEMPHDRRVDLVQALDEELREDILPLVARAERADIRRLASYPEDTAGALMTTDYAALPPDITVREALERLRLQAPDRETIYYVYVVDERRRLIGFVSLKDLILARPQRLVRDVMHTDVISVRAEDDREHVADVIGHYDLLAVPVVNGEGVLVGIITVDDIVEVLEEEATEDIYHYGAAGEHVDYLEASPWQIARQRLTWLVILVVAALFSSFVLKQFSGVLTAIGALAYFIPLLCGSGGNAGTQTSTVIIRGLATGEILPRQALRVATKEAAVALLVGLGMGVLAAGQAWLVTGDPRLSLTVGLAMLSAVVVAKVIGGLLPIALQRLGLDPALMSAPLITTVLDSLTLTIYLTLATVVLL